MNNSIFTILIFLPTFAQVSLGFVELKNQKDTDVLTLNVDNTTLIADLAAPEIISEYLEDFSDGPIDLTVEYIRDPSGISIIDSSPEYSWVVPESAVAQNAYQILVSSSQRNNDSDIGDVWDSQRINTNQSSDVEHDGNALVIGKSYYWKVRIWDVDNKLSNYSKSQEFKIGRADKIITTANKFQVDRIKPVRFEKRGASYFIDFGKASFATIDFTYHATSDDTLTIRIGEELEKGSINRTPAPASTIRYQEITMPVSPQKTHYQLAVKTDRRNTIPNKAIPLPDGFPVLMPFRYAEIDNAKGNIIADDFTQLAHHSYWEEDASGFDSSDDILNQVWGLCKYSIKATTFNGLYVDGDRERIPYEADAYLNQLSHYTTDQEYAIARQTIEYFMEHPTWPTEWQQHVALMFHADYMYTGNTELIEKYYDQLKYKTLYELAREDGLITSKKMTPELMKNLGFPPTMDETFRDIVDWPSAGWGGDPKNKGERDGYVFRDYNTVVNAFYYQNMIIMAEFAEALGKTEEALEFELRALKAKMSLNEKMFDQNRGVYLDGIGTDHASLHANMLPLAFGMVPDEHVTSVLDFIKSRGMACSVYGSQYLMDALYNAGESDYALALMVDTSDRSWYNMIRIGSTITLEAWDIKYKNNLDWNHAWGAVPANAIPRGLWGIQPKTPGFGIAKIRPQMSSLKNSSIKVPTIKGPITAEYQLETDRLQIYNIHIPANMVAEFELPISPGKEIIHNGEKVNTAFDNVRLGPGKHEIRLVVNSF